MSSQQINPGDMVVELAALVVTASILTGAVSSAWILWLIKRSWLISGGAFFAGGVISFFIGQITGFALYRSGENTTIVKVGHESLTATIPAGLAGGMVTAIAISILALLILGARNQGSSVFAIAIICGVVLGIASACMGSLL